LEKLEGDGRRQKEEKRGEASLDRNQADVRLVPLRYIVDLFLGNSNLMPLFIIFFNAFFAVFVCLLTFYR
jgi:hypothetical protein